MKSNLDNYLFELTDNLAFLKLDDETLKNFENTTEDFVIPIFVEDIKKMATAGGGFSTGQISSAIIYLLGIDKNFKHNEIYKKFLKRAVDLPSSLAMELAIKKYDTKSYKDALVYMRASVLLNPDEKFPIFNLGQLMLEFSKNTRNENLAKDLLAESEIAFQKTLEIDKNEPVAHFQLGLIMLEKQNSKSAKEHFELAIKNGDDEIIDKAKILINEISSTDALVKAEEQIEEQNYVEALEILSECDIKNLSPIIKFQILYAKGFCYKATGEFENALEVYSSALKINNQDTLLLADMGVCSAYMGDLEQALEFYLSALEIEKDSVELLNNISIIYLNMGNLENAKKYIKMAVELSHDDEIVDATILKIREAEERM